MRTYIIKIILDSGRRVRCRGLYASDWEAIAHTQADYPSAVRIVPVRLHTWRTA